jgi:hypothetical protein
MTANPATRPQHDLPPELFHVANARGGAAVTG